MGEISRRFAKVGLGAAKLEQGFEAPDGSIHTLAVPGKDAEATWRKLRDAVATTKLWPVLIGPRDEVAELEESFEGWEGDSTRALIAKGESLPASTVLDSLAKKWQDLEETAAREYPSRPWPEDAKPFTEWSIPSRSGAPHPEVLFALLPTETSWHVPALLRFGGWNECPDPYAQVALLKHWHEKYGAEVAGMTHDELELAVARPPQDREAALVLAKELYDYCDDLSDVEGLDWVEGLAARLLGGTVWHFWWD